MLARKAHLAKSKKVLGVWKARDNAKVGRAFQRSAPPRLEFATRRAMCTALRCTRGTRAHTRSHAHAHLHTHAHAHTRTRARARAHKHARTHAHAHAHMHACMQAYMHAHCRMISCAAQWSAVKRTVHRWVHGRLLAGWRTWLIDHAFTKAGEMLVHSAIYSRMGRGFARLYEAYKASLLRYQHGKFAAAAALVFQASLKSAVEGWRWYNGDVAARAAQVVASDSFFGRRLLRRLHERAALGAAAEAREEVADEHSRRRHLRKLLVRMRRLGAPGGEWQLRQVGRAYAKAGRMRKGLASWQRHCFRLLCNACAMQHNKVKRLRVCLHGWSTVAEEAMRERAANRAIIISQVNARLLDRTYTSYTYTYT